MNEIQRWAVGFFIFSMVVGVISAPVHDAPIASGAMAGLSVYLGLSAAAFVFEWMLNGVDGVRSRVRQLVG